MSEQDDDTWMYYAKCNRPGGQLYYYILPHKRERDEPNPREFDNSFESLAINLCSTGYWREVKEEELSLLL